jgi:hypothetical protein
MHRCMLNCVKERKTTWIRKIISMLEKKAGWDRGSLFIFNRYNLHRIWTSLKSSSVFGPEQSLL